MSLLSLSKRILHRDKQAEQEKNGKKKPVKDDAKDTKFEEVSSLAGRIQLRPLMTEKSVQQHQKNTAVFRVHEGATKQEIMKAVQDQYGVKPVRVRTVVVPPKTRRRGSSFGKTNVWKKAYVTVEDIQSLNT